MFCGIHLNFSTFDCSHRKPSIYFLYRTGGPVITKTSSGCSTGFAAGAGSDFTAGADFAAGVNLTGGPVITKTSSDFSTGFDTGARSNGVDVGLRETGFGVGAGSNFTAGADFAVGVNLTGGPVITKTSSDFSTGFDTGARSNVVDVGLREIDFGAGAPEPVMSFAMLFLRDGRTVAYRGAGPSKTNASDSGAGTEAVVGGCNGGGAGAGTELETMEVVLLGAGGCICVGGGAWSGIELEAVLTPEEEAIGEGGSRGPPSEYPEIRKS
jgi:hypothetical protein